MEITQVLKENVIWKDFEGKCKVERFLKIFTGTLFSKINEFKGNSFKI